MSKDWYDYIDSYGLITQKQSLGGDGGDSLNRSMVMHFLNRLQGRPSPGALLNQKLGLFSCFGSNGKYRRHPDPLKWYARCNTTSRDQLTPLVIMLGYIGFGLKDVFIDHLKRGLLFTYNTRRNFQYPTLELQTERSDVAWNYSWKLPDLTGPEFWALYIRGFKAWYLYPLLCLFDIQTLGGAILLRWFQPNTDDVINHAVVLEYSKVRLNTPIAWLARKLTPRAFLQKRLDAFFGREVEPPINELYRAL